MNMIEQRIKQQQGTVLVISLVFLLVLTLVAVVAMQSTVMEQKISSNTAFKTKAFENSESPRPRVSDVLDHHVFERGWTGIVDSSSNEVEDVAGLTVVDQDGDEEAYSVPANLFMKNENNEDITNHTSLTKDMVYERTSNITLDLDDDDDATNDVTKTEKLKADLYVYRNSTHAMPGHSAAMLSGYEGTGKALAGSGAAILFDVRSIGTSMANAKSATSADSRIMIRN